MCEFFCAQSDWPRTAWRSRFQSYALGCTRPVVYGDRGFEPLYVLPVTVFAGAQNHLGNRDNLVIGGDISLRPRPGLELYGAWFLDDMVKFDPSAFANQFALQLGAFWSIPWACATRMCAPNTPASSPYVYAHNFDINTFEHRDALLGYPTGPNADCWFGQVTHRFSHRSKHPSRLNANGRAKIPSTQMAQWSTWGQCPTGAAIRRRTDAGLYVG